MSCLSCWDCFKKFHGIPGPKKAAFPNFKLPDCKLPLAGVRTPDFNPSLPSNLGFYDCLLCYWRAGPKEKLGKWSRPSLFEGLIFFFEPSGDFSSSSSRSSLSIPKDMFISGRMDLVLLLWVYWFLPKVTSGKPLATPRYDSPSYLLAKSPFSNCTLLLSSVYSLLIWYLGKFSLTAGDLNPL